MLHGKCRVPRQRDRNRNCDSVKVDRQVPGKADSHVETAEGCNYLACRERHRDYQHEEENLMPLQRGEPEHWPLHECMVEGPGERRFGEQPHYRDQAYGKHFDQHRIPRSPHMRPEVTSG